MSLLDNDFDINGEGLLIDICIKYFKIHTILSLLIKFIFLLIKKATF